MKKLHGGYVPNLFVFNIVVTLLFTFAPIIAFVVPVSSIVLAILYGIKKCSDTDEKCNNDKETYKIAAIVLGTIFLVFFVFGLIANGGFYGDPDEFNREERGEDLF